MTQKVFLFIICLGLFSSSFSQEKKITFRSGAGYYLDTFGMVGGQIIWMEGGARLNTGFFVNGRVSMANINWEISQGAFKGYNTIALRQMVDLTFSRPVKLKGMHFLEPGIGIKFKKEFHYLPDFGYYGGSGSPVFYTEYSSIFYEIGFTMYLDYNYQFSNGFYLGLRTDTNVMWAVGFEGLTISPILGFRF
jgi:hypothetical protein